MTELFGLDKTSQESYEEGSSSSLSVDFRRPQYVRETILHEATPLPYKAGRCPGTLEISAESSTNSTEFNLLPSNSRDLDSKYPLQSKTPPLPLHKLRQRTPPRFTAHKDLSRKSNEMASTTCSTSASPSSDWLDLASTSSRLLMRWITDQFDQFRHEHLKLKSSIENRIKPVDTKNFARTRQSLYIPQDSRTRPNKRATQWLYFNLLFFVLSCLWLAGSYVLLDHVWEAQRPHVPNHSISLYPAETKVGVSQFEEALSQPWFAPALSIWRPGSHMSFRIIATKMLEGIPQGLLSFWKGRIRRPLLNRIPPLEKKMQNRVETTSELTLHSLEAALEELVTSQVIEKELHDSNASQALQKHSSEFQQRLERITDSVYVGIGYGLANVMIVRTSTGIVVIDTLENPEALRQLMRDWEQLCQSSVRVHAVIYTHFHADHVFGSLGLVTDASIEVIAHEKTAAELNKLFQVLGPITYKRSMRQFGSFLSSQDGFINSGIGTRLFYSSNEQGSLTAVAEPTLIWSGSNYTLTIDDTVFELYYAPGESLDQIVVYLPGQNLLHGADNLYKSFPNIYAVRGTETRDAVQWVQSLDLMRRLKPAYLVLGHTSPIVGSQLISETLTAYRDAIQYVHDQTLRHMNQGLSPDEIVAKIELPPELSNHPYLQQYYGTVAWSIRAIYQHYLGWFSGEPEDLHPLTGLERSAKLAGLAGGREKLLELAFESLKTNEDLQWALELVSHARRLDPSCPLTKKLQIQILRRAASQQTSAPGRNWYLTTAKELQESMVSNTCEYDQACSQKGLKRSIFKGMSQSNANQLLHISKAQRDQCINHLKLASESLHFFKGRVIAEKSGSADIAVKFIFEDTQEFLCVHLRHRVLTVASACDRNPDATVITTDLTWRQLIKQELTIGKALLCRRLRFQHGYLFSLYNLYRLFRLLHLEIE